ncbi:MAG TPA: hypothetical protein VLE44_01875 [Candidatus Saccharimonadales bacterium]|nr:hypothetical protein [Candidatus Saccharimonadales bacterium]
MKQIAQLGTVKVPEALKNFQGGDVQGGAIGAFLNLLIKLLLVGGGIYALFNLVLAGYSFLSAGDDPKKVEAAWAKIYQTAMGLLFMAGAFVLAAIFGQLIFGDWTFILNPQIPTI